MTLHKIILALQEGQVRWFTLLQRPTCLTEGHTDEAGSGSHRTTNSLCGGAALEQLVNNLADNQMAVREELAMTAQLRCVCELQLEPRMVQC